MIDCHAAGTACSQAHTHGTPSWKIRFESLSFRGKASVRGAKNDISIHLRKLPQIWKKTGAIDGADPEAVVRAIFTLQIGFAENGRKSIGLQRIELT